MPTVPNRFDLVVTRAPDAVALSSHDHVQVSYAELDRWSAELCHSLRSLDVAPGDRVGLLMARSPEMIVAMVGTLRAAAVLVPLDLADPAARIAALIRDTGARVAICDAAGVKVARAQGITPLEVPPSRPRGGASGPLSAGPAPADLAGLMFTSGSTGGPKAIMVEHRNIVNLVTEPSFITLGPDDRLLQLAPVTFDAATFEIWGALLNGARLVLAPPLLPTPPELSALVTAMGITVLWLTAALFHRQVDEGIEAFGDLRAVLAGGERLSASHVRRLRAQWPHCRIINGYGPTETTTFASCHVVTPADELDGSVPIGRPIQNVTLRVTDPRWRAVPNGTAGELCVGGAGVTRGYWRRPALTAEKFIPDPAGPPGARCYHSGDRVRRRGDGTLEFIGRIDDQVKLRGYRIEPGEVEEVLTGHPSVRQAAVVVRRSHVGDPRLVAFIVPQPAAPFDRAELRRYAAQRLPAYLMPALLIPLDRLPVTVNGKLDRKRLPAPDWTDHANYG